MRKQILLSFLMSSALLAGCVTETLNPQIDHIVVTRTPASQHCEYLGSISSTVINGSTVPYTSDANLFKEGIQSLKKQASNWDGNFIQITSTNLSKNKHSGYTLSHIQTLNAKVYKCQGVIIERPF